MPLPRLMQVLPGLAAQASTPTTVRMLFPNGLQEARLWSEVIIDGAAPDQACNVMKIGSCDHAIGITDTKLCVGRGDFYVGKISRPLEPDDILTGYFDGPTESLTDPMLVLTANAAQRMRAVCTVSFPTAGLFADRAPCADDVAHEKILMHEVPRNVALYVAATAIYWDLAAQHHEAARSGRPADTLDNAIQQRTTAHGRVAKYRAGEGRAFAVLNNAANNFIAAAKLFLQAGETALAADCYLWSARCMRQADDESGAVAVRIGVPPKLELARELFDAVKLPFGVTLVERFESTLHQARQGKAALDLPMF